MISTTTKCESGSKSSGYLLVKPPGRIALKFTFLFLFFSLAMGFTFKEKKDKGQLVIKVDNVSKKGGIIWIGLYDSSENYLIKEKAIVEGIEVHQLGPQELVIKDLAYGTYAIALFHDLNANGEMDRNLLGIPSEPYAFSKKPKSKWRLPKFDEVKFNFTHDQQQLHTKLKKWWD